MKRILMVTSVLLSLAGCAFDGDYAGEYDPGTSTPPNSRSSADAGAPFMGGPPPPAEDGVEPGSVDSYEDVGTNPYTATAHDPFSTFAADVDTASYDIFVRDALAGYLPDPSSVRLEEYVNSFDYAYEAPEPGAEVPFSIALAAANHPFREGIAQLRVGIQAEAPPEFVKLPTNLTFLVDVSGSMGGEGKIDFVRRVLRASLDELDYNDTVSIVTYAGSTQVRLTPTALSDRAEIERVIDGLEPGGGTAGGAGLELAYDQAEAGFLEGGFNHIVLCTDGDFNIGPSSNDELVALIEEKRETGVTFTALGFGRGNLNDAMMERVSNAGNGIYSVIRSAAHADRYAENGLLNAAQHVAKDMKIQVEFNPEHVVAYRLLGYENRALADDDFRVDAVDAGEVGAGHRVTALYELVLADQTVPAVEDAPELLDGDRVEGEAEIALTDLVEVRVRWKDLAATAEDEAYETSATLTPDAIGEADDDFLWAASIAAFAEILKESPYGDAAHLDAIEAIVTAQAERDDDRAQFADLFALARTWLAPEAP